jgi:3-methyladenine DNA glycosylase AlkD
VPNVESVPNVDSAAEQAAAMLINDVGALAARGTPSLRGLRRQRTKAWKAQSPQFILAVALELTERRRYLWVGHELIRHHAAAFAALNDRTLAKLARGLDSWGSVDGFGRILSGPAWAQGHASDLIDGWSRSRDRWLRRTALVSTIALNMESDGGHGDTRRTLAICTRLAAERDDMIEKALSWALRCLIPHDAAAVRAFIAAHDDDLAARVKREVTNKLRTGLKNPRKPVVN